VQRLLRAVAHGGQVIQAGLKLDQEHLHGLHEEQQEVAVWSLLLTCKLLTRRMCSTNRVPCTLAYARTCRALPAGGAARS
jgi:hypothetical protein